MIPITIDVFTDGANASRCTFNLPGAIVSTTDFGFGFPGVGPNCTFTPFLGLGADFTNVGAIELRLGGPGLSAADVTLDFFRTDSGMVPVELMEFGIDGEEN